MSSGSPGQPAGGPDRQMSGWPDVGSMLAGQTPRRGARIMDDMLMPRVTELVRQGHVVTQPVRLRGPLVAVAPAATTIAPVPRPRA
jgi:hypothetical protein